MRVVLFGATGMVGQGVLRECLLDPKVDQVLAVGRRPPPPSHDKLRTILHADLCDLSPIAERLAGYDACFFCVGVSSAGTGEADYVRITHDTAMAAARTLVERNPAMTFVFVSGAGADARSRVMWARIKGRTEAELMTVPFRAVYIFRPAYIQPLHGITSRTALYRIMYVIAAPLYPLWKALLPGQVTTTETLGRAMLAVARHGAEQKVLHTREINRLGA